MTSEFPVNPAKKIPLPMLESPNCAEAERHIVEGIPFGVKGTSWAASSWTIDGLKTRLENIPRQLVRKSDGKTITMSTAEFIDLVYSDPGWKAGHMPVEGGGPPISLNRDIYSHLKSDIQMPSFLPEEFGANIMMRNSKANAAGEWYSTPCHYELNTTPSFYLQIVGRKHLYLFAPEESPWLGVDSFMAEMPYLSNSAEGCEFPDRYPEVANATCYEVVLEPGVLVFWPEFWFHWFIHYHDLQMNLRIDWTAKHFKLDPLSASWAYTNALAEAFGGFAEFGEKFPKLPQETQDLLTAIEQNLIRKPQLLRAVDMTRARFGLGLPSDTKAYKKPGES